MEHLINKIHLGDCLEFMRQIPDRSIDLILTSPPYDNLRNYKGYTFDFENTAKELYRILKDGGVMVWVVGDAVIDKSETGTSFKQALYFKDLGLRLHDTMIYKKNGSPFPEKTRYSQVFEYMFVFCKGNLKTFNPLRDRKNRWTGTWGVKHYRNKEGNLIKGEKYECAEYSCRFNVWKYNTGAGFSTKDDIAYKHPAIFPEALAEDHILSWSNENDIVLDPFMGSGTTAKMAVKHYRKFIGCDISAEYVDIANKRLDIFTRQMCFKFN